MDYIYAVARLDLEVPSFSLNGRDQLYISLGISMFICTQWNALALFMVACLNSWGPLSMESLNRVGGMLSSLVSLLSGSSYLIVIPQLLSWFECENVVSGKGIPPMLRRTLSNEMADDVKRTLRAPENAVLCWEGEHVWFALTAMLGLIAYILPVILVSPFFLEDYTGTCSERVGTMQVVFNWNRVALVSS